MRACVGRFNYVQLPRSVLDSDIWNVGRVRDRDRITIDSIRLIAMHTQVSVLGLAGCDMTDDGLILLAQYRNAGLERISVNNCYRVTNKTVQAYVRYCPNLSVLK